jgi:hypothetical protein
MQRAARRRTTDAVRVAAVAPAAAPLARPSGRFDALVDMGNPMKGINLFPYLRRRVEGRALGALGPAAVLELSRTVREAAMPRRWPREVFHVFFSFVCALFDLIFFFPSITSVARRVASHGRIAGRSTRSMQLPAWPDFDPRRGLPPRGGSGQPSCGSAAGDGWHLGATVDGTPRHAAKSLWSRRGAVDGRSPRLGLGSPSSGAFSVYRRRHGGWHTRHGSR